MEENQFNFPTEEIELPSKGLLYPEDNPLSSGKIEMKYMTAKEEDILTNQNYIQKGIVLDKLLQSLIVSKINYKDLIVGDKNALLIAARILGYGKDYAFTYNGEEVSIDLSELENKEIDESLFERGKNEFEFTLPSSNVNITFQILTHGDESKVDQEIRGLKKLNKSASPELSTRLKHILLSVNGDYEKKTIRDFVDNYFLARDTRAFRQHVKQFQPDITLTTAIETSDGGLEDIEIPINLNFFWPDVTI
jgi:hypothetical protein